MPLKVVSVFLTALRSSSEPRVWAYSFQKGDNVKDKPGSRKRYYASYLVTQINRSIKIQVQPPCRS